MIDYRSLFFHREKLLGLEGRLTNLIEQEERYEGHSDPEFKAELAHVRSDMVTVRKAMDIAKYANDRSTLQRKQPLILEHTAKLHFPVGTL